MQNKIQTSVTLGKQLDTNNRVRMNNQIDRLQDRLYSLRQPNHKSDHKGRDRRIKLGTMVTH